MKPEISNRWLRWEAAFEAGRGRVGWVAGPLIFFLILLIPIPAISVEAHRLAAILGLVLVLWVCETVPLAVTALLGPALCIMLGVGTDRAVLAPFGSPIVFLFIGTFFLAAAMQKHGLDRRLALLILSLPGVPRTPGRLYGALALLTAGLSMWMSNVATTAVMLPIAMGIIRSCPDLEKDPESRSRLILLVAFSASVGGLATPVGTPPNLIALGFLRELAGVEVGFLRWMQLAMPLTLILLIFLILLLRPKVGEWSGGEEAKLKSRLLAEKIHLGAWTAGERNAAVCMGLAIGLWLYPGAVELLWGRPLFGAEWVSRYLPEETVGLMAGLLLFFLPVRRKPWEATLAWPEAVRIDWGTILLFAGGLALGKQIFDTGLARAMGEGVSLGLGHAGTGTWTLVAVAIVLSLFLSETTSNTATANVMVPVMIAVALAAGVNPIPVALACCLACSFGFAMPVSTGPNAMAYGTGEVRLVQMMKYGILLDGAGLVAIFLVMRFLAPLLGWGN
jgi:solute carrier family 13 (sodium-dependent dicarboxylate transporter), member 2/3/5